MISNSNYLDPNRCISDEPPILTKLCPNCDAIGVKWENHKVKGWKEPYLEDDQNVIFDLIQYKCPCCGHEFKWDSFTCSGFGEMSADDFHDLICDQLPENFSIAGFENNLVIGINYNENFFGEFQLKIKDYQFDFEDFKTQILLKIKENFNENHN